MHIVQHDLKSFDPEVSASWHGLALEAMSDEATCLATVAARVDGHVAVVFERWVKGDPGALVPLIHHLIMHLRDRLQIREIRAGATDTRLYHCYLEQLGMKPWRDLVRYERPAMGYAYRPKSTAVIRQFRNSDQSTVYQLLQSVGGVSDLVRLTRQCRSRFVVAEVEHRTVGYALSYIDGSTVLLKSMVVDSGFRRLGIGWDLVCDAIRWAEGSGLRSCLNTQADNVAARRLYESLGYQATEQVRLVYKMLE